MPFPHSQNGGRVGDTTWPMGFVEAARTWFVAARRGLWWSIFRNSGTVLVSSAVAKVFVFVATAFIARLLTPGDFGWYSTILTYVYFLSMLSELGMDRILTREIAGQPQVASEMVGAAMTLRLTLVVLLALIGWAAFPLLGYPAALRPIATIALVFVVTDSLTAFAEALFSARMAMTLPAIGKLAAKALLLVLVWVGLPRLLPEQRLLAAVAVTVLPDLVDVGILWGALWRQLRPRLIFGWSHWWPIVRESWPLALAVIFGMTYTRIDVLLLTALKTSQAVGNYAAAVGLVEIWGGVIGALSVSLLPVLSRSSGNNETVGFWRTYQRSFTLLMLLLVPISFVYTAYASEIVAVIYGSRYSQAPGAMQILIWSQVFASAGIVYMVALIANHWQRLSLVLGGVSAVLNIVLNLLFIPKWGIVGSSWATLVSYGAGSILLLFSSHTRPYILPFWRASLVPLLASLPILVIKSELRLHWILGMCVCALVYLSLVTVLHRLARYHF